MHVEVPTYQPTLDRCKFSAPTNPTTWVPDIRTVANPDILKHQLSSPRLRPCQPIWVWKSSGRYHALDETKPIHVPGRQVSTRYQYPPRQSTCVSKDSCHHCSGPRARGTAEKGNLGVVILRPWRLAGLVAGLGTKSPLRRAGGQGSPDLTGNARECQCKVDATDASRKGDRAQGRRWCKCLPQRRLEAGTGYRERLAERPDRK